MKKITCIAIDDEPLALLVIASFCERLGNMELLTFSEPRLGLEEIVRCEPHLVFLDIEMNSISGLEIARSLPPGCCLIFTSAHSRYALDGFELDAVDFLHKPFAFDRFEKAVEKALRHIEIRQPRSQKSIVVKQEYNNVTVTLSDILYVEALGNYSKIFRINGGYILSRANIKGLLELLPGGNFLRIHRSYIIAVNQVESFSKRKIKLSGKKELLPIGQQFAGIVYDILMRYNMLDKFQVLE